MVFKPWIVKDVTGHEGICCSHLEGHARSCWVGESSKSAMSHPAACKPCPIDHTYRIKQSESLQAFDISAWISGVLPGTVGRLGLQCRRTRGVEWRRRRMHATQILNS